LQILKLILFLSYFNVEKNRLNIVLGRNS